MGNTEGKVWKELGYISLVYILPVMATHYSLQFFLNKYMNKEYKKYVNPVVQLGLICVYFMLKNPFNNTHSTIAFLVNLGFIGKSFQHSFSIERTNEDTMNKSILKDTVSMLNDTLK
jgi:hypothetical protein